MRSLTDHLRDLRAEDSRCERVSTVVVGGNAKRAIDILFVAVVLPFVLPVLLLLAALVLLTGGRPIFYAHPRIGHGGREFRCFKFRTMVENGDEVLRAHLLDHPEEQAMWEAERKLVNDPRVTDVGAFLRQTSLDELPQLLNVLRGEMSLVGPRPIVRDELLKYGRSARHYLLARPGLTGLWQISGRSDLSYDQRVRLDRFYVTRWSLLRDLWIVARTIPAVIASKGAR